MSEILFDIEKLETTLKELNVVYSNLEGIETTMAFDTPPNAGIGQVTDKCREFETILEQVRQAMLETVEKTVEFFGGIITSAESQNEGIVIESGGALGGGGGGSR